MKKNTKSIIERLYEQSDLAVWGKMSDPIVLKEAAIEIKLLHNALKKISINGTGEEITNEAYLKLQKYAINVLKESKA